MDPRTGKLSTSDSRNQLINNSQSLHSRARRSDGNQDTSSKPQAIPTPTNVRPSTARAAEAQRAPSLLALELQRQEDDRKERRWKRLVINMKWKGLGQEDVQKDFGTYKPTKKV